MNYKSQYIDATSLPDAWFQTVYKCLESGRDFNIDRGSFAGTKRLEFDYITIKIACPNATPRLPQIPAHYNIPNPVADDYVDDYLPYLMTGQVKEGESYTYGQRICAYPIDSKIGTVYTNSKTDYDSLIINVKNKHEILYQDEFWNDPKIVFKNGAGAYCLNQMELLIWTYKNKGFRNNQMVLQIAHPTDMLLQDPPCLRSIDTRIQDGKLNFIVYFRSWDLWGGFPANLAGIQLMKEYIASEIGVEDGSMIVASKGLHMYDYVWELAGIIRGKTIQQFREEMGTIGVAGSHMVTV